MNGEVVVPANTSATDQASTPRPSTEATGRLTRSPQATSAAPTDSTPARNPKPAPVTTHPANSPGRRWPARFPTIAPTHRPLKAAERTWCSAGDRSATWRRIGASSTTRTSAASSDSGPPRLPDRSPSATRKATARPRTAAPWSRMSPSPRPAAASSDTFDAEIQITAAPDRTVT